MQRTIFAPSLAPTDGVAGVVTDGATARGLSPRRWTSIVRRQFFTLSVALIALLGLAVPATAGDQVPFKASDIGTFSITPLESPLVLTRDVATGHATHLGRYTLEAQEIINLATLAVTDGAFTLTGANGDTVFGTYEGTAATTADPLVITYHVQGPVTGGTGRFSGASGVLVWDGIANLGTGQLSDRVRGWVSSPGSLR